MNNRDPFFIHTVIIKQFREDPAQGKQSLKNFLNNNKTSMGSKLRLLALLLNEFGENKSLVQLMTSGLLQSKELPVSLIELAFEPSVEPPVVDKLIEFLSRKKLLRKEDKGLVYNNLSSSYGHQEGELYYLLKAVADDDLSIFDRHDAHYKLSLFYAATDMKQAHTQLKMAYDLEKKKAYGVGRRQNSVSMELMKLFKKTPRFGARLIYLKMLVSLEPQDPQILKTVFSFFEQALTLPCSSNLEFFVEFCYFLEICPALKAQNRAVSDRFLKLPDEACSLRSKVNLLSLLEQYESVIQYAQLALQQDEANIEALYALMESLEKLGRYQEALQVCEKISLCPEDSELKSGLKKEALSHSVFLNIQLGNFETSKKSMKDFSQANPDDYDSLLAQALDTLHEGKLRKAKTLFSALMKKFPEEELTAAYLEAFFEKPDEFNKEADPFILSEQLQFNLEKGNFVLAEKIGLFLFEKAPSEALTICRLWKTYQVQGRFDEGLRLLLSLPPAEQELHRFNIAWTYFNLCEYEKSEELFQSILRDSHPDLLEDRLNRKNTLYLLLDLYTKTKDFQKGLTQFEALLPSLVDSEKQIVHLGLAIFYNQLGSKEKLEQEMEQVLALGTLGNLPPTLTRFVGLFFYTRNRIEEALPLFKKYLLSKPKDSHILYMVGSILYNTHRKKALHYFSTALSLNPALLPYAAELPLAKEDSVALEEGAAFEEVEEKEEPTLISLTEPLRPNLPAELMALTPEQEEHRYYQDLKQQAKNKALEEKESEENGWHLPGRFLSENDPWVFKLALASHLKEESCVYAYLDVKALQKYCPEELISRSQAMLQQGKIARRKQVDSGVRFFGTEEAAQTGFAGKLKHVGDHGDQRLFGYWAKARSVGNKKLFVIDTVKLKVHRGK